jgi:hypothetical protein
MFADYTKITKDIKNIADCLILQTTLCAVERWSIKWQLPLNNSKCVVQHFGRSNPNYSYHLAGSSLVAEDYVKDLGVIVSRDLSYHKHIDSIISASVKKYYIIKSCLRSKSIRVLKLILQAYIIPALEYGSVIWNPHSRREIDNLEDIQCKVTAMAVGKGVSYEKRLELFGLKSLQSRRNLADLAMYHKILSNMTCIAPITLFNVNSRRSRRSKLMIFQLRYLYVTPLPFYTRSMYVQ